MNYFITFFWKKKVSKKLIIVFAWILDLLWSVKDWKNSNIFFPPLSEGDLGRARVVTSNYEYIADIAARFPWVALCERRSGNATYLCRWTINLSLDVLVSSITVYFYSFVFWLSPRTRQTWNSTTCKNIQRHHTPKLLIRCMDFWKHPLFFVAVCLSYI